MDTNKSLLTRLGETLDAYRAERHTDETPSPSPVQHRLPRVLRWLTPNGGTLLIVAALLLTQSLWAKPFQATTNAPGPSATTVNYQGHLANNAGAPLDGTYGMSFALYDAAAGGNLIWGPEAHTAVPVSDGLFSVGLGGKTSGGIPTTTWNGDRYLEITVGEETLSPRELIRSVPIAGMALTVPDEAITAEKLAPDAIVTASGESTPYSESLTMVGNSEDVYIPYSSTEATVQVTKPSRILITADGGLHIQTGSGQFYGAICRDGVRIGRTRNYSPDVTNVGYEKWSWTYIDLVDAGTYTYSICARGSSGLEARWYLPTLNLVVFPGQ